MAYSKTQQTAGFRQMESDISSGKFDGCSVIILYGTEDFLTGTYAAKLKDLYIDPAFEAMDFVNFDGAAEKSSDIKSLVDEVILACDTMPMMSQKRVVYLSRIKGDEKTLASEGFKTLASYIGAIPPSCLLIISAENISKRSSLYKAVNSAETGAIYEFDTLEKSDVSAFIKGRFRKAGIAASSAIISTIIENSGYLDPNADCDLFSLDNTLAGIASYVYPRNSVEPADLEALLGTSANTNVFSLLDAACAGRKGDAMLLLMNITNKGENTFGLLALLQSQFEMMLAYREFSALRGMSIPEIARELGIKSEFRLKKAAGFASKYSADRLIELLSRLYRVEEDIKTGLYSERLALTMFIAEM